MYIPVRSVPNPLRKSKSIPRNLPKTETLTGMLANNRKPDCLTRMLESVISVNSSCLIFIYGYMVISFD